MLTTLDEGRSSQKQSKLEQVVDDKGNVLEQRVYRLRQSQHPRACVHQLHTGGAQHGLPPQPPARVYTNTYLSGTGYASRYIFNRLVSSVVTAGGVQTTLAANYYDQYDTPYTYCSQFFPTLAPRSRLRQHDGVNYGPAMKWRGNVTAGGRAGGVWRCFSHDITGLVTTATDAGGMRVDVNPTANNAVPGLITPNSNGALSETLNWDSFLGLTSDSGPNGAVTSYGYDGAGRPSSVTTPHGATISLSYSASPPLTTRTVNPGGGRPVRWTKTYHDGLGRPVRVEEGHGTTVVSIVETEYDACACSPLGKVKRGPTRPGARSTGPPTPTTTSAA